MNSALLASNHENISTSETSDDYHSVIVMLAPNWRVISDCTLQWIIQRRRPNSHKARPWEAESYHQDREALMVQAASLVHHLNPGALEILEALPERFPREKRRRTGDDFDITDWLRGTRLIGRICSDGQLGLLVPLAIVRDELAEIGVHVTIAVIASAIKRDGIAPFPEAMSRR
jgi:hypothetical protein